MTEEIPYPIHPQRLQLLKAITKGATSATAIAERLSISVAHVSSQLKLLEANGYIRKEKSKEGGIGKPRTEYHITKQFAFITIICADQIKTTTVKLSKRNRFLINTTMLENDDQKYFLQKFYFTQEELINNTQLVALLNSNHQEINLLIIADDVEEIRKQHSTIILKSPAGQERRIIIWSHTPEEVERGLTNKENYFIKQITQAKPLWKHSYPLKALQERLTGGEP